MPIALTCEQCEVAIDNESAFTIEDDGETIQVCERCYEDFQRCDRCELPAINLSQTTEFWNRYTRRQDRQYVCYQCADRDFTRCEDCEDLTPNDEALTTASERDICQSCYENSYDRCWRCEDIYPQEDLFYSQSRDNYYCNYCYDYVLEEEETLTDCHQWCDYIKDYSFDVKAELGFKDTPKDRIYFGVELEVMVNADTRDEFTNIAAKTQRAIGSDFARLKEDGSVEPGFEIVTCPASFEMQCKVWSEFFNMAPLDDLDEGTSGSNIGMHVHVSRKRLTELQIGKILVFINLPENKEFITGIAGRDSYQYARLCDDKKITSAKYQEGRYEAINLMKGTTVEFRIFASTLDKDTFLERLEFVKATLDFTKQASYRQLRYTDFLDFLKKNRSVYKRLYQWSLDYGYRHCA